MTDKMKVITNMTLVPISFIIIVWFIVVWVTDIKARTEVNANRIVTIEYHQKNIISKLDKVNERLSRIEGLLTKLTESDIYRDNIFSPERKN